MTNIVLGRVNHPCAMISALPLLFLAISGCREQVPSGPDHGAVNLRFALSLNAYYSYDNWKLDADDFRIPSSKFRSAWRVTDTNAVIAGFSGVAVVRDSIFAKDVRGVDSLVSIDHRYFRTSTEGEVFEFGFIARLVEQHDTAVADTKWDKLFSSSVGANSFWVVEERDSLAGGNVYASVSPSPELVGTTINGVSSGVLAYHIELTGQDIDLHVWMSGAPSAFARFRDSSPVNGTRFFQELVALRNDQ